ncbi:S-adenosyl-L-methionine-dependent methyltransferase [Stereum hirsutum FP-91666 SS1]|uniref:S-adenosyl-L-methionine-dependent methyltransferase n=1 Tax=Stereum hirsutum (strain FP-91666) TaxID=721885 RepID=UPI0004410093|nr:S-adenosyl-L-methionine-dependent methyltransferase [Stereum hirsutum FP-91666 SS1]EIM90615.1 S-adenosyl-L-methionine-dependent methyltransferase [Stereum hirsutum FP-91666 SS1]
MHPTLSQLAVFISDSVESIEASCAVRGLTVPDLDSPFDPSSEDFRLDPTIAHAINVTSVAAKKLNAILQPPHVSSAHIFSGHYQASAMQALVDTKTVEILRDAGSQGLHVDQISTKNGIDSKKQARMLRFLATKFVFREVRQNVFANNRISSMLDTEKSVDELRRSPRERIIGFNASASHVFNERMLAASCLLTNLLEPKTRCSDEPNSVPWHTATGVTVPYWTYIQLPGQELRLERFGNAMRGINESMVPPSTILGGFAWSDLNTDAIVVDVGSGVGATSLVLSKAHPKLHAILQDKQPVIDNAELVWTRKFPPALQSGRVKLQGSSFNCPPVENASVFLFKNIVHDWSDTYAKRILTRLRDAATPETKLLLVESLVEYACRTDEDDAIEIPGARPRHLLANFGNINCMQYLTDLSMLFLYNSQERTIGRFFSLLEESGWRITQVYRPEGSFLQQIETFPVPDVFRQYGC